MFDDVLFDEKSFALSHRIHVHFGPVLWIGFVTKMQILFFRRWYPIGIDVYGLSEEEIEEREKWEKMWNIIIYYFSNGNRNETQCWLNER